MQSQVKRREQKAPLLEKLHPVLGMVYANRGIEKADDLDNGLKNLIPFDKMLGIDEACLCIYEVLKNKKNILIVGDFDADGATSTAVAIRVLKCFGAANVNYLVPNRFSFGYGLTKEIVDVAAKEFNPNLIITVDNGIANHDGVDAAKNYGIDVVITDHHLAGETLPKAAAIVNPNQPNDEFPSKSIAGVGVIFYVLLALRRKLCAENWFEKNNIPEPNMSQFLDIVALGTVADVVSLDHNNRILVHQGLNRIRRGKCIPGIKSLLDVAGKSLHNVTAQDLGFIVGPRLNAAGRLDDMSHGIECLLTEDMQHAKSLAESLDVLNKERRSIEEKMQESAMLILQKLKINKEKTPLGVCLFDKDWHQGVIGILASRIKDKLYRPVIAFSQSTNNEIKGSARSIKGVHIRDVLAEVATQNPGLILKFGGHAMAAGLSIMQDSLEAFSSAFNQVVQKHLEGEDLNRTIYSDGELNYEYLTLDVAELIQSSGPWGQSFEEPLFDGKFQLLEQRIVGGKHLKITLANDDKVVDGIVFNIDENIWPNYRCSCVNIVYKLDVNEFRNRRKVQLIIDHIEAL